MTNVALATPSRGSLLRKCLALICIGAVFLSRTACGETQAERIARRDPNLRTSALFWEASAKCGRGDFAGLKELFDLAAAKQIRDRRERGYGNFAWTLGQTTVRDDNSVDFCMESAAPLYLRYGERMDPAARQVLTNVMEIAISGLLAQRVSVDYTNIALSNAGCLMMLGEIFGRPDVFREGRDRFVAVYRRLREAGVSEYATPTYTAIDIGTLNVIAANVRDPDVRFMSRRALEFFWTDLSASAFLPAFRLGGAHGRDYDYLHGRGAINELYVAAGMLPGDPKRVAAHRRRGLPPQEVRDLARKTPRAVEALCGDKPGWYRRYWAGRHVALGTAGMCNHLQDMPFAIDFEGHNTVRGYFIADGRHDPYGKIPVPEGGPKGVHRKTLHLKPFFASAQRARDAIGLVVYRPRDLDPFYAPNLESHIVLPATGEIMIGDRSVSCAKGKPFRIALRPQESVFVRVGAGAAALRVLGARDDRGKTAEAALVWDDNRYGACTLTVCHKAGGTVAFPSAAFWARVTDEAADDAAYAAWRAQFAAAAGSCTAQKGICVSAAGGDGPLALAVDAPYAVLKDVTPAPPTSALAVDGRDFAAEILVDSPGSVGRKVVRRFLDRGPMSYYGGKLHYAMFCTYFGALEFAEAAGDAALRDEVIASFEPFMKDGGRRLMPNGHVDHSMSACVPLAIYRLTGDRRGLEIGRKWADGQWSEPRKGSFADSDEGRRWLAAGYSPETRLWMDDMFMITILQLQAYRATHERKYAERAAREMTLYLDRLQNADGLFYHASDVPFYWGRGDGWMAAGMAMLLKELPEDIPERTRILEGYRKMMAALLKAQGASGMWTQLVGDAGIWDESSGTAMFAYAFAVGANRGWLDRETYGVAARKAYSALVSRHFTSEGDVTDVCEGTNKKNSREWYLNRKRITGDLHGQAPLLWLSTQLLEGLRAEHR